MSMSMSMSMSNNSNNSSNNSNNAPPPPPTFNPQEDWTLISQGAEARLWKIPSFTTTSNTTNSNSNSTHKNKKRKGANDEEQSLEQPTVTSSSSSTTTSTSRIAVAKERFAKAYRHAILDERLTKNRCRAEARILHKCLTKGGMDVPSVYQIQGPVLYLEFIDGVTVRDYLLDLHKHTGSNNNSNNNNNNNNNEIEQVEQMARNIGTTVGTLHSLGVVHGDLTTSNMMLRSSVDNSTDSTDKSNHRNLTLIDFGLGKNTESAEERAVDLYVLERALLSTHPTLPETFWGLVMQAYEQAASTLTSAANAKNNNNNKCQATLTRLEQVRQRGRKRECFG